MRRSARLAAMTKILVDRPNRIVSLSEFVGRFGAAKSTVSEDLAIIRDVFAKEGLGRIETITGAAGGVRYVPVPTGDEISPGRRGVVRRAPSPERILPGGFLYISDLVSSPSLMSRVGEIFAAEFHGKAPDAVVTLETRGIPVALMTARALDVPLAIVRRIRPRDRRNRRDDQLRFRLREADRDDVALPAGSLARYESRDRGRLYESGRIGTGPGRSRRRVWR